MPQEQLNNEKHLIAKISEGDEDAFREIFNFYRPRLYTAALQMTGDAETAQDLYQELFLKVWLRRTELPAIENFPGWLFTVSRNLIFDSIKRTNKNRTGLLDILKDTPEPTTGNAPHATPDTPAHIIENKEVQKVLKDAVDRLSPRQKEVYTLIRIEGRTRIQTAESLNISPETVKATLQTALRNIRVYCLENLDILSFITITTLFAAAPQ